MRNIIAHQLLSGIRDMGAQSGQEVERRKDAGGGGLGIATSLALPAIVGDLTGFISQNWYFDPVQQKQ